MILKLRQHDLSVILTEPVLISDTFKLINIKNLN